MVDYKKQQQIQQFSQTEQFFINATSGGIAGAISKTLSAPLERIKIVMQTARQNPKIQNEYQSPIHCGKTIYKNEGILAFWQGNFANMVRYLPNQALNFSFKEKLNKQFNTQFTESQKLKAMKLFLSGGIAGCLSNFICYPLEYARTRISVDMQNKGSKRQYRGIIHCIKVSVKNDGITGLYRGISINLIGAFIYRGAYFGLYDFGKHQKQLKEFQSNNFFTKFIFAQFCTIVSGTISYPQDTINRKMMMSVDNPNLQYRNTTECAMEIYKIDGVKGFFRGNVSNCLRCISGAACLVLFDVFQNHINTTYNNNN